MAGLSGCATLAWYGQAARGQLEVLAKREDIAEKIADPATPEDLRERLRTVLEIREFASGSLGLPDSGSYTRYADLGREAPLWNVVAAPRYSVEPKTWCYPLVGCVAYRGFFRRSGAQALASELAETGMDVAVFPATAYSTLGWFDDPVLESMLSLDDAELAELIFHELAHERVYVAGNTAFNEAYASFIGRLGVRRWLLDRGDMAGLERWRERRKLDRAVTEALLAARAELDRDYASHQDPAVLEQARQRGFESLRRRLRELAETHDTARLDGWLARPVNNAHLALVATYESGIAAFERLYRDECHQRLACVHERVRELARADEEARAAFLDPGH